MAKAYYTCTQHPFKTSLTTRYLDCPIDGGPIEIKYDYKKIKKNVKKKLFKQTPISHWKYHDFYPNVYPKNIVSLEEGNTPLIPDIREKNLFFKFEGTNPTGSFKDRGTTLEMTWAKEHGVKRLVCASTGNMGASVSAYAARAGIPATIIVPRIAEERKVKQMKAHGAYVKRIAGDYTVALKETLVFAKKYGHYPVGDYPFRREGEKSVGFEIADQFDWKPPANIVCPIGNGTLISGIYKAFVELKAVGLIQRIPKLVGVQAKSCQPVTQAFEQKKPIKPIENPETIASAIACGDPLDGILAINAIEQSKGTAVSVGEEEIRDSHHELAQQGVYAEPSGAVAFAGYKKSMPSKKTVVIVTGHGLKTTS
jgi:threonine synthase